MPGFLLLFYSVNKLLLQVGKLSQLELFFKFSNVPFYRVRKHPFSPRKCGLLHSLTPPAYARAYWSRKSLWPQARACARTYCCIKSLWPHLRAYARTCPETLFNAVEKMAQRNFKRLCNSSYIVDWNVLLSSFNSSYVCAVQAYCISKCFLR